MTIFDFYRQITFGKKDWSQFTQEEQNAFNPFMTHKLVSMNENFIEVANIGQSLPHTDKEKIYKFYCEILPRQQTYSKYIKSTKEKSNESLLILISSYFECSNKESEEYIEILGKDEIDLILEKMGLDKKEIKKLWKIK